jgi:hypothetical protein
VFIALLLSALVYTLSVYHPADMPCPSGSRVEHPKAVHLVPSVVRHRSWVEVPLTDVVIDMELLVCADGFVVGRGKVDEGDLQSADTVIHVATHWVGWLWVSGRLDTYQTPDRFLVVFPPITG